MERIFFTMETFSGVSSLILALFLHFSEVPKGEMCRRNKHSRIYVEMNVRKLPINKFDV